MNYLFMLIVGLVLGLNQTIIAQELNVQGHQLLIQGTWQADLKVFEQNWTKASAKIEADKKAELAKAKAAKNKQEVVRLEGEIKENRRVLNQEILPNTRKRYGGSYLQFESDGKFTEAGAGLEAKTGAWRLDKNGSLLTLSIDGQDTDFQIKKLDKKTLYFVAIKSDIHFGYKRK